MKHWNSSYHTPDIEKRTVHKETRQSVSSTKLYHMQGNKGKIRQRKLV